jgi:predicted DNA-binding transcriptional regulator YafY
LSRTERLFTLMDILRRHRRPVSGARLAAESGISLRSLYRDIATLQAQGATIEGEAGVGYVLRPGFMLPPLMFSETEIEAIVLGSRWVAERGDDDLAAAARNALAKILAVLPPDLRGGAEQSGLLVGPAGAGAVDNSAIASIRQAIRAERKIAFAYRDGSGVSTRRTVWPIALGYFDSALVIVAWCELRLDFRSFRADRLQDLAVLGERYPRRKAAMLKEWRTREGIPES